MDLQKKYKNYSKANIRIYLGADLVFLVLSFTASILVYYFRKVYIIILSILLAAKLLLTVYAWILIENAGNSSEVAKRYFLMRGIYFLFLFVYSLFLFIEILLFAASFLNNFIIYLPFMFYLSVILYELVVLIIYFFILLDDYKISKEMKKDKVTVYYGDNLRMDSSWISNHSNGHEGGELMTTHPERIIN